MTGDTHDTISDSAFHRIRGISDEVRDMIGKLTHRYDLAVEFGSFRNEVLRSGKGYRALERVTHAFEQALTPYSDVIHSKHTPNERVKAEQRLREDLEKATDEMYATGRVRKGWGAEYLKKAIEERRRGISSVITIAGLGAGIFFLSTNITGNAIADLTTKTTSFFGAGLVIVGLVAGFFWLKSRRK
jgi:hypothetical protein